MTDRQAKHRSRATRLMTAEERIATSGTVNSYLYEGFRITGTTCVLNTSIVHVAMESPDPDIEEIIVVLQ